MDIPPINRQVKRNVGAVPDVTDFGSVHWAVRDGDPPGAESTIGLAIFDGGKSNARHIHPNCEEVVYVMEGEVQHTLGAERTTLRAGDLIVVPRNVPHQLINTGKAAARVYIVFSSPDRQFVPVPEDGE